MRYKATLPLYSEFQEIDAEKGIIRGVSVASEGEAKGHGVQADAKFIRQVVAGGKANPQGLKARFGHPNMCATALGTYVGRFKNFKRVGEKALADLHLDESAKDTPNGNLYDYVLSMAKNNPDMFGTSIAFKPAEAETKAVKNEEGDKIETDYARIDTLMAADLVDSPALGNSLFSSDDLASQVTMFLDSNPEIFNLLSEDDSIVEEFMGRYKAYKNHNENTNNNNNEMKEEIKDELSNLKAWVVEKFQAKSDEGSEELLDSKEVEAKINEFEAKVSEQDEAILKHNDEVEALNVAHTSELETATGANEALTTQVADLEAKLASNNATETVVKKVVETEIGTEKVYNAGQQAVLDAIK